MSLMTYGAEVVPVLTQTGNPFIFTVDIPTKEIPIVTLITEEKDISVESNAWVYRTFSVAAGTYSIKIDGTGDIDLYTSTIEQPTYSNYECRPYLGGSTESCTATLSTDGTIYVGLNGYQAGIVTLSLYSTVVVEGAEFTYYTRPDSIIDCDVDWGDGIVDKITSPSDIKWNHIYATGGQYDISITGQCSAPYFSNGGSDTENASMLTGIKQWGDIGATDWNNAFNKCINFNSITTIDQFGKNVINTSYMLAYCEKFNEDISNWDTSQVADMSGMFNGASAFNQSIDAWDVSAVTNMDAMFYSTDNFNQPLNSWNTVSLTRIYNIFHDAIAFNKPLYNWNVSNVGEMRQAFWNATSFNQDLSCWDVRNFGSEPDFFSYGCPISGTDKMPKWGQLPNTGCTEVL